MDSFIQTPYIYLYMNTPLSPQTKAKKKEEEEEVSASMGWMKQGLMVLSVVMAVAAMVPAGAAQAAPTSLEISSGYFKFCLRYSNSVALHCLDEETTTSTLYEWPSKLCCKAVTELPYLCSPWFFTHSRLNGPVFHYLVKVCRKGHLDVENEGH